MPILGSGFARPLARSKILVSSGETQSTGGYVSCQEYTATQIVAELYAVLCPRIHEVKVGDCLTDGGARDSL